MTMWDDLGDIRIDEEVHVQARTGNSKTAQPVYADEKVCFRPSRTFFRQRRIRLTPTEEVSSAGETWVAPTPLVSTKGLLTLADGSEHVIVHIEAPQDEAQIAYQKLYFA